LAASAMTSTLASRAPSWRGGRRLRRAASRRIRLTWEISQLRTYRRPVRRLDAFRLPSSASTHNRSRTPSPHRRSTPIARRFHFRPHLCPRRPDGARAARRSWSRRGRRRDVPRLRRRLAPRLQPTAHPRARLTSPSLRRTPTTGARVFASRAPRCSLSSHLRVGGSTAGFGWTHQGRGRATNSPPLSALLRASAALDGSLRSPFVIFERP
jgi:hypothetical protein